MPVNRLSRLSATPGEPATPSRQNDDRTSYVRCRSTDSADSSDSAPPRANLRQLVAGTTTERRRLEGVLCSALLSPARGGGWGRGLRHGSRRGRRGASRESGKGWWWEEVGH